MYPYILIVDDHSVVRTGLKLLLEVEIGIPHANIKETCSCGEMMNILHKENFTHIFLDIILADGNMLELIPVIRKMYPAINMLVFTMQPAEVYANVLESFGIYYYVSKSFDSDKIVAILKNFFLNDKTETLTIKNSTKSNVFSTLTLRELQVLHYLLKGMNTKAISNTLNLQSNTISTYKKNIFEKTNTYNMRQLLELATAHNINF